MIVGNVSHAYQSVVLTFSNPSIPPSREEVISFQYYADLNGTFTASPGYVGGHPFSYDVHAGEMPPRAFLEINEVLNASNPSEDASVLASMQNGQYSWTPFSNSPSAHFYFSSTTVGRGIAQGYVAARSGAADFMVGDSHGSYLAAGQLTLPPVEASPLQTNFYWSSGCAIGDLDHADNVLESIVYAKNSAVPTVGNSTSARWSSSATRRCGCGSRADPRPGYHRRFTVANDIDRLYQLPLGDFTTARNALAKTAGAKGAGITSLEKPSAAAWAVNQLFWGEKRTYERLIRASERVRAAHAHMLKGRKIDLRTLEQQHGAAVKDAAEFVRAILARAGDPATAATMKSVVDTLQALPGGGAPGRLTKALAPIGFGAFGALMKSAVSSKALAEVVTFALPKPKPDEVAEAARRAREAAKTRLRILEAESKQLQAALAGARAKRARAEAARVAAETNLQSAAAEAKRRAAEVSRLESEARATDQARVRLADDLSRR